MDFEAVRQAAESYKADMSRFLRDMISHPSESCGEREVVACIRAEMEKLGYDKCGGRRPWQRNRLYGPGRQDHRL